MAKLNIYAISIILSLFIATQIHARQLANDEDDHQLLLDNICLRNENLTKIHFYVQDIVGGPNTTSYEVARASITGDSPTSFGITLVLDNPVTAGPAQDSEELGRAQGLLTSTDVETRAMAMSYNFVFTSGKYNGSTLSIVGRNPVAPRLRQLAVVGGTGVFRFTRGYAVAGIYSARVGEDSGVYSVLEYTIYATFCPLI